MAKDRKQNRGKSTSSPAERGQQAAKASSIEERAEQRVSQMTSTDVAHKGRQKRFGHN
ncbi:MULTISPECIES: hypothetical protein [Streptomyces]|uniref:DUF5302 domain-containing protein n=1 Tax=Streptomyces lichenis TaxID=2306967 RepID=A0ABT0IGK3_9ACTN|nr:hypothetical protein [Streptomyces lichenis]MCK8680463.1 hypothetical protein [Streptomyces lichenis]